MRERQSGGRSRSRGLAEAGSLTVGAYDKVSAQLDGNDTNVDVQLQPSPTGGDVELLLMKAGSYAAEVNLSADARTTDFVLNGPVVLVGPAGLLAAGAAGAGRCPIAQLLVSPAWSIEG
jgi:hypothetical protein